MQKLYTVPPRYEKWQKECPYCKKTFLSHSNYHEHVKSVHENRTPFACEECPRKFALSRYLVKHKKLVHKKVECDICGHVICNSFELERHRASNYGIIPPNTIRCDQCSLFFHQQASLDILQKTQCIDSKLSFYGDFLSITYKIIYLSLYTYIYATMSTQLCQLGCRFSKTLALKFQIKEI